MKKIINFCLDNALFVNMVFAGIAIAGIIAVFTAQREAFPRVEYNYTLITTVFPGATADDIEKYISIPLEDQLREVDGIEELYSTSLEARSIVVAKLDPNSDDTDKVVNDIKSAIDRVEDLPDDADRPLVTELSTAQTPIINIAVINKSGIRDDADEFELRKQAKMLEHKLLELRGIARIEMLGYRDREILVEMDSTLLDYYHVSVSEVILALSRRNINIPGGIIHTARNDILVRTISEVNSVEEVKSVLIRVNDMGYQVRVGDVARVKDSFEEETEVATTNGVKSVTLTVLKKESSDIITLMDSIRSEIESFRRRLPAGYEIVTNNDLSYFVKRRLDVLVNNGLQGLILVAISLILSYGWRISLFTSLAVPFSIFITFIWMGLYNVSINLNSMFGLIMALGMLVDNNIVVSDNIYRHLEEKWKLRDAVVRGAAEVTIPIAATALTTIASFAPLMFMSGIIGKFIWTIPAIVSMALIASWAESAFVLPVQIHEMQRRRKSEVTLKEEEGGRFFKKLRDGYVSVLASCVRHRYRFVAVVTLVFFITVGFAAVKMKFLLFPAGGIETFVVRAEAPTGTSVQQMSGKLSQIERLIAKLPKKELDSFTARAGIIQEHPGDPYTKRGSNYGIIHVYLTPEDNRARTADQIIDGIRKEATGVGGFDKIEFKMIKHGPPSGAPIFVTIKGDDFGVMKKIAAEYVAHLKKIPGLKDIKDNFEPGKEEVRIVIDEARATRAGISVLDIATTVRSLYAGNVSTSIKKAEESIDIRVIFPPQQRTRVESLNSIKVTNRLGNLIPLSEVASFKKDQGISVIYRKDWRRYIAVSAEIDENAKDVYPVNVNRELMAHFANIEERHPGYTVNYEGEFKDTQESMQNLLRSFLIAAVAIYIILVATFRSLTQPLIIMGVIPLSFVAVVWVFFLHGLPLSFLAIMGVVGLAGVVVNNSIVYLDFANLAHARGSSVYDASLEAGAKRMRPILLSSITTVLGLLPTAYGIGGNDPFLKPMALSMGWGLALGTVITLFITPVLYNVFADMRGRFFKKLPPPDDHADFVEDPLAERIGRLESNIKDDIAAAVKSEVEAELARRGAKGKKRVK
ncbi:MAG TPA: efflux RND transporter permease subunit [Spirochaetota bacterium]|nr:efflux RND transporter permease subunit [Spirochaetota bacterium]